MWVAFISNFIQNSFTALLSLNKHTLGYAMEAILWWLEVENLSRI